MANTKGTAASASSGKTYDFNIAKGVLSETKKSRLICLFLNSDHGSINWPAATTAFECASVESMRVMTRATLKKITDAEKNGGVVPAAKTITPKKRKAAAATAEDDDEEGGEETPKPTTRKSRGKGKKKADTPVEDDEEGGFKGEEEDEFSAD